MNAGRLVRLAVAAVSLGAAAFSGGPARAQEAEQGPVGQPGLRIVTGQSTVVGGNGAGARERALDEAFRQGIDQSLAEMLDAPTRAAQARSIKALGARARTYMRRYRTLEEGEVAGLYTVKLEVEIDEPALRRAIERWGAPASGVASPGAAPPAAPGLLLVAPTALEAAPLLLAALVAQGARAQLADAAATAPPAALAAASRATLPQVAFVTAEAHPEGLVRGTTKLAVACRLGARVVSVPAGLPVAEHAVTPRAFADDEAAARAQCLAQAAADLAPRLAPAALRGAGGDLRAVTIEADVVEPAAVVALLKNVRAIGAVSSAELRHIAPGKAEIRARTRALASALAPALARDAQVLALSNVEIAGDLIKLRARLRAPAASASPPMTTP